MNELHHHDQPYPYCRDTDSLLACQGSKPKQAAEKSPFHQKLEKMMNEPRATLFIHFRDFDMDDLPEDSGIDKDNCSDSIKLDFSVRTAEGGFTEKDMFPDTPAQFIKQGVVMALIEQIVKGITSERGISLGEAVDKASAKMDSAHESVALDSLMDKLKLELTPEQEVGHC